MNTGWIYWKPNHHFDLTTEAQRARRYVFLFAGACPSRLGGGDGGKRKASMLDHKEKLDIE